MDIAQHIFQGATCSPTPKVRTHSTKVSSGLRGCLSLQNLLPKTKNLPLLSVSTKRFPNVRASGLQDVLDSAAPQPTSDDVLVNYLSENAEVSVFVLQGTNLVREAQNRHKTSPTATAALGRVLVGTLLLGALKGPEEVVQVTFNGRGELGQIIAVSQESVYVKGFVNNPLCDPPINSKGKLDVGTAVGPGILTVVRSHPAWQFPYTGSVPLQTGEIAEDLAHYLAESEQINTALSLGVLIGKDTKVEAAGGFLVQVLPNCSEETLIKLEKNVMAMPAVSELISSSISAESVAERLLDGLGAFPGNSNKVPIYGPCSVEELKPRMLKAVESLGKDDVEKVLSEIGKVEVRCEFCSENVVFNKEDLQSVLEV